MARERPQLREESVPSLLKQSWLLWRSCLVPVLILALVSTLYSYALETYVSPVALSHMDGNGNSTQSRNSSSPSLAGLAGARDAQDLKMARELFEGGGGEIEDKDKGFVARYVAMFLASVDEAVMESLADSREKKMSVYDYDSRGGTESSRKAALNLKSSSHPNYDVDGATTTSDATSESGSEEALVKIDGVSDAEPIPQFSLKLRYLWKNESTEAENYHEEKVGIGMPSARLMGGRNLDRGARPHLGLTLLVVLGMLVGALTACFAIIMCQHAALLGTIAYSVVSTYVGKRVSAVRAMKAGIKLGLIRLVWLAFLHIIIRDLMCLFIMKILVGGVLEPERADKLVLRLSFMPFSVLAPFRDVEATSLGMAFRIGGFVSLDYLFDAAISCIYIVACWVTIMERQYWGFSALTRGWKLISGMQSQVIALKVIEGVLTGRSARWILQQFMGPFLSLLVVSAGQVYFIICWLVLYFSARYKQDQNPRFNSRVLEDFLDRLR